MHWHLLTTENCNSQCRYCYEKSMNEFENGLEKKWEFDFSAPANSEVNPEKLKNFVNSGDVLIFYGGEPLVNIPKIKEVIDCLKNKVRYCMQTNGKLLNELPSEYMNQFSKILVSLDGDKKRTDFNRGEGTYNLVLKNLKLIRKNRFQGEIVARMTISQEFPDVFKQIKNLIKLIDKKIIDSIHWQIDAGFYKNDFIEEKFANFAKKYNKEISKLIDFWLEQMKSGKVLKLYPLLGFFENIYYNTKTKLRCGAGYAGYAITTDGIVTACPIMNNVKEFYCGNLDSKELKQIDVIEPCISCSIKDICGGRCLYSNHAKLWPEKGQEMICQTIQHLTKEIKRVLPTIKELIKSKIISEKQFEYEKYFGPEIVP